MTSRVRPGKPAELVCEPLLPLSSVTEGTQYQADVESGRARQFRSALAWKEGSVVGKSVYIRNHKGSFCLNMPDLNL